MRVKRSNAQLKVIARPPECTKAVCQLTIYAGRIVDGPVNSPLGVREDRARLIRMVTNRDDVVEVLVDKTIIDFGSLIGDVDLEFAHHFDRLRPHMCRRSASAEDSEISAADPAQQPFDHLRTSGVVRAEKQDANHLWHFTADISFMSLLTRLSLEIRVQVP